MSHLQSVLEVKVAEYNEYSKVIFYLRKEEKQKLKALVKSYQLNMRIVLRECVLNMIKQEDKKYHDLMIDLFEAPYTNPEAMHLFDEEIENIYSLLEDEDTED
jgi:hypothetical protein